MGAALTVVGGGRMGTALVKGLLAGGRQPGTLMVVEADPARRRTLGGEVPGVAVAEEAQEVTAAVVAVKPADAQPACAALAAAGCRRALSIMAGVTLSQLERWLPDAAVIRAMPNTPATVGAGISALAAGRAAGPDDVVWAREVLEAVGEVVEVAEAALDAVTGLSGSGPAYVFLVAEALIDAGVLVGLPRPLARSLALHTLAGSAALLLESGAEPETLRAQVTSPGGTTAAGLRVLESAAVRSAFLEAVAAATERSRDLGMRG